MKRVFVFTYPTFIFFIVFIAILQKEAIGTQEGVSENVSKQRQLNANNVEEIYDNWRFLVIADIHGMTPFSWHKLTSNQDTRHYIEQQIVVNHINGTYGGELIMTPGDAPSYGGLLTEDIVDRLGGDISEQEAVYNAGRNCYNTTRELFKSAGYDTLIAAVGDHEIGGNKGFRVGGPESKITTVTHARRAVGDGFNRNNGNEFIFDQSLFGIPSRPLGTPYENTTFAYLHKNALFITVDAFEIVGNGSENYIDQENGYGGEGSVTCTVTGGHLIWLESILKWGKTDTNVRHIFVQAHLPIIQPVRKVKCSGQFLDAGEQSDFWNLMESYDVDIYFAGEVHTNTATKTRQSGSNLIQIVSRGNRFSNFLTVDVAEDVIDVKIYNEFGEKSKWNAQYKEAGRITIDKTNSVPDISSSGMLELLDLNSSIISFDFEEIKPMGTRQILGMCSEDNLIATSITIRDNLCTESFFNIGTFGAQYDAQIGNVALAKGRYGGYSASFNKESRMAIFGTGPFSAGEVISFGFWFKTRKRSRKMVLLHYASYWDSSVTNMDKDYFSLVLDNGIPVIHINEQTSLITLGLENLADSQWHHIAVSMPHKSCLVSELEIYVDGEAIDTTTIEDCHIFCNTSGRLSVGGYGYSSSGFEDQYPGTKSYIGKIDDFLLYARPIDIYSDFFKPPSYSFFHDGHCASGRMGDNRNIETVDECAILCSMRKECGYFAYDDSMSYAANCATYSESDGCPGDNSFPEFNAYKIVPPGSTMSPKSVPYTAPSLSQSFPSGNSYNFSFFFFHNGHCASGWMGDNRNVETVDECAIICSERDDCGYFAYDDSMSYAANCATYSESDGCPDDNSFPEFNAYKIVPPGSTMSPTSVPYTAPSLSHSLLV